MGSISRDVRTAFRALGKAPGFAAVVLLTLAVAIGANAAIFSVVDGVMLRPLPYPDADRLVTVAARTVPAPGRPGGDLPFSDRGYWHFVNNSRAFERFGGYEGGSIQWALTGEGAPIQVDVAAVTASALEVLGAPPQRGRLPTPDEDLPEGPQIALISDALWVTAFGSDPSVVGRIIELDTRQWEVIGVMPQGFHFPNPDVDIWIPSRLDPASENFGGHHIQGIARLAPGATLATATADAEGLISRFGEAGYGPTWFTGVFSGEATVRSLKEGLVGEARTPLLILLGTAGFVLLIACSNIANLFLVRAEARTRETAIRVALGSGRRRLVQFVLTESLLLGLLGGVLGVLLAYGGLQLLVSLGPASIPRLDEIRISGTALGFTAGISVLSGILFGALPALRTGSKRMLLSLRDGGRGGALGKSQRRSLNVLVVAQVALALILVVGSGLMVRTFRGLRAVDPGFDTENLLTFGLSPAPAKYGGVEPIAQFYDELRGSLEGVPGVNSVGAVNTLPLTGTGTRLTTAIDEFPTPEDEFPPVFGIRRATPGYFETMGIPLVEGRTFTADDHNLRLGSLIISEAIKNQYWPNESALGKRITTAGAPARVVGVVGDVRSVGLDSPPEAMVYKPMLDSIGGGVVPMSVTVRTGADPAALVPAIRGVITAADPDLPITNLRLMEEVVGDSLSRVSFTTALLALAAAIALFLGAVGIYGVISYGVSQRTGEIGVRLALGSDAGRIRNLVLRDGIGLTGIGIGLGLGASLVLGRLISSLLYGVSPYDLIALAGGSIAFLLVGAVATGIPATRAARVAPAESLRSD